MECAKAAERIARSPACDPARGGEPMIFLNIGEPDFTAPPRVQEAAERCHARRPHPVHPGHWACRRCAKAISGWYAQRFGLRWTRRASW
jgi:aspartate/methionine/tyrosine aminotransferase